MFSLSHPLARAPKRATVGSAGYDLASIEALIIPAYGCAVVPTGVSLSLPPTTYGRVAPRSGLAKRMIDVGAGVIDSDYRGDIAVIMYNHGAKEFSVNAGDRIAQLIIEKIWEYPLTCADQPSDLGSTERGADGFGSTGICESPAPSPE